MKTPVLAIILNIMMMMMMMMISNLKRLIKEIPPIVKYKISCTYNEHEGLLTELDEYFDYGESVALRGSILEDSKSDNSSLFALSSSASMSSAYSQDKSVSVWLRELEGSSEARARLLVMYLLFGFKRNLGETISEQMLGKYIRKRGLELLRAGAIGYVKNALKKLLLTEIKDFPIYEEMEQSEWSELHDKMKVLESLLNLCFILVSVAMAEKFTSVIEELVPLMETESSLPCDLLSILSKFADGGAQAHLPLKKILFLTWKILLFSNGDQNRLNLIKTEARKTAGLPFFNFEDQLKAKATRADFKTYQEQISSKYSFFFPQPDELLFAAKGLEGGMGKTLYDESIHNLPQALKEGLSIYSQSLYESYAGLQARMETEKLLSVRRTRSSNTAMEGNPMPNSKQFLTTFKEHEILSNSLKRIDKIYSELNGSLWSLVVFLLKANLYVTSNVNGGGNNNNNNNNHNNNKSYSLYIPITNNSKGGEGILEKVKLESQIHREKDLIAKSVTLLILVLLKQFKACHVFQFENLCRNILDANGVLLYLKVLNQDLELALGARPDINFMKVTEQCRLGDADLMAAATQEDIQVTEASSASVSSSSPGTMETNEAITETPNSNPNSNPLNGSNNETNHILHHCIVNYLRIMQKVTKNKAHRISQLIQLKSVVVFKKVLKCDDEFIQRYTLKLVKSQSPFLGRKFRISHMSIFSGFYRYLRPEICVDPGFTIKESENCDSEQSFREEKELRTLLDDFDQKYYKKGSLAATASVALGGKEALGSSMGKSTLISTLEPGGEESIDENLRRVSLPRGFSENWQEWLKRNVYIEINDLKDLEEESKVEPQLQDQVKESVSKKDPTIKDPENVIVVDEIDDPGTFSSSSFSGSSSSSSLT